MDALTGIMDFNIEESQVARAMIEQSKMLTVLVDHSKYNKLASFEVCPLSRIDRLVSDQMPPADIKAKRDSTGCEVILAAP